MVHKQACLGLGAGDRGFLCVRNETLNMFIRRGNHPDDVSVHLQFSFCLEKTRS